MSDELPGGTALTERSLVSRFGVSRTPIREVLMRLQNEYLVEVQPGHGAFVRTLTPRNVRDLLEARQGIEPMIAGLAATHRPEVEVEAMVAEAEGLGTHSSVEELLAFAASFHDAVARWTDNGLLYDIYSILRKQTMLVRRVMRSHHEMELISLQEHKDILEAIRRQNPEAARSSMQAHLARSYRSFMMLTMGPRGAQLSG